MNTSRLVRRSAAVFVAGGAAAALTLISPAGALADVQGQYGVMAQADANYTGSVAGADCNLTSPVDSDDVQPAPKALTKSGTKTSTVSINATFTNSTNSADRVRVKGSYTSKVTLVKKHKDLSSLKLGGKGHLAVTNSLNFGSQCEGGGEALGLTQILFTEHRAGQLVVTRDTVKSEIALIVIVNLKTEKLVSLDEFEGDHSHAVSKANLKPGKYAILEAGSGIFAGSAGGIGFKAGSGPKKAATHTSLSVTFKPKSKH